MILLPAIDIYERRAVRLYQGDYNRMTVYTESTEDIAADFIKCGADHIHLVDLEGARDGNTPNFETIINIKKATGVFCEVGGGIRSTEIIDKYLEAGIDRVIIGTAATRNEMFIKRTISYYGDQIAIGVDVKDGMVAIKGWTEKTDLDIDTFCSKLVSYGTKTIICTDISKDGAMRGTNLELYKALSEKYKINIIASGGISSYDDLKALSDMNISGAIIGKAYYTGAIDLKKAVELYGEKKAE